MVGAVEEWAAGGRMAANTILQPVIATLDADQPAAVQLVEFTFRPDIGVGDFGSSDDSCSMCRV